jgi:hypothetical protein
MPPWMVCSPEPENGHEKLEKQGYQQGYSTK